MRRLIRSTGGLAVSLLIGGILALCSLGLITAHPADAGGLGSTSTCSSACHGHGQHAAANSQSNEENDDDKEPTPPILGWLQIPINLSLLYLAPVLAFLPFSLLYRKMLLTTQLRF